MKNTDGFHIFKFDLLIIFSVLYIAWAPPDYAYSKNLNSQVAPPPLPAEKLYEIYKPAIVKLMLTETSSHKLRATGTGFFISPEGELLTNEHVIREAIENTDLSLEIQLANGKIYTNSEILFKGCARRDHQLLNSENLASLDLCLLQINSNPNSKSNLNPDLKRMTHFQVRKDQATAPGTSIFVISHPKGLDYSITTGIISAYRSEVSIDGDNMQFTAPISKGSSGAPIFNNKGELLGIATHYVDDAQNLNLAISSHHIYNFIQLNQKHQKSSQFKFVDIKSYAQNWRKQNLDISNLNAENATDIAFSFGGNRKLHLLIPKIFTPCQTLQSKTSGDVLQCSALDGRAVLSIGRLQSPIKESLLSLNQITPIKPKQHGEFSSQPGVAQCEKPTAIMTKEAGNSTKANKSNTTISRTTLLSSDSVICQFQINNDLQQHAISTNLWIQSEDRKQIFDFFMWSEDKKTHSRFENLPRWIADHSWWEGENSFSINVPNTFQIDRSEDGVAYTEKAHSPLSLSMLRVKEIKLTEQANRQAYPEYLEQLEHSEHSEHSEHPENQTQGNTLSELTSPNNITRYFKKALQGFRAEPTLPQQFKPQRIDINNLEGFIGKEQVLRRGVPWNVLFALLPDTNQQRVYALFAATTEEAGSDKYHQLENMIRSFKRVDVY